MKAFYDGLVRRRAELVARSSAQRQQVVAATDELRQALTKPVLVGVGVAATLLSSSPKLRGWVVRAWAAYAFIQRMLGR